MLEECAKILREGRKNLKEAHVHQARMKARKRYLTAQVAERQRRVNKNGVAYPDRGGAFYVPYAAVRGLHRLYRRLSMVQESLDTGAAYIRFKEAHLKIYVERIKSLRAQIQGAAK